MNKVENPSASEKSLSLYAFLTHFIKLFLGYSSLDSLVRSKTTLVFWTAASNRVTDPKLIVPGATLHLAPTSTCLAPVCFPVGNADQMIRACSLLSHQVNVTALGQEYLVVGSIQFSRVLLVSDNQSVAGGILSLFWNREFNCRVQNICPKGRKHCERKSTTSFCFKTQSFAPKYPLSLQDTGAMSSGFF